jgi:hypothetical protein
MDRVIDNRYIQAYFVRTKPELTTSLQKNSLQTVFSPDTLYLRDYNNSYNKIDSFIQKSATILDSNQRVVRESAHDVVSLAGLAPGKYTLHVQYALMIPDRYVHFIEGLQHQFGIQFNVREKHILALYAERSTRGVIYAPKNVTFSSLKGPLKTQSLFTTPFSNNAFYVVENTQNNTIKDVIVPFYIDDVV